MIIKHGSGTSVHGPGVVIDLTGDEIATAIDAYLVAHGVHVRGPRTITARTLDDTDCALIEYGQVYVDPSGFVVRGEESWQGKGPRT